MQSTLLEVSAAALLSLPAIGHAGEVIANASVELTAAEVRELYVGEKQLAGNMKLVPVDNAAAQAEFAARVLQVDPAKYTSLWIKKAFREGLNAPPVKGGDAEVISFVRSTPGAVGYVAAPSSGVKVLQKY